MHAQNSNLADKIQKQLDGAPDLVVKTYDVQENLTLTCLYLSTLVDKKLIDELVISQIQSFCLPETENNQQDPEAAILSALKQAEVSQINGVQACTEEILNGQCLVYAGGDSAVSVNTRQPEQRGVVEPQMEAVVRGPREGFVEEWSRNISLIRKRLKNEKFVFEKMTIGRESRTTVCLLYMRGIADPALVEEFRSRLKAIETDSILESAYIEEFIQDQSLTPFPQLMASERPDAIAAKLLEGQAAVITDGTPIVLAGPLTFFQLFTAPEDYYQRADIASLLRWVRILAFIISIFTPALYIALASYHQELLPTSMLANLASQREGVPFPGVIEAFIMMILFEVLREAGLRMPRLAGQAISIVGALVLGQAAVEAGIVSAAMVIVVALTAIANFVAPSYGFGIAQRIIQFAFMLLTSVMGFFGLMCGVFFLLIHLVSLTSMGTPYFSPVAPLKLGQWKDTFIRERRTLVNQRRK